MLQRQLNILQTNSFFLFGARGTGKSTLLEKMLPQPQTYRIDLLDLRELDRYSTDPESLERVALTLPDTIEWIVLDEVQKLPRLLDTVHRLIEKSRFKFALTGSSARKLKAGGANLLAGRAFVYNLFPFTSTELGGRFQLSDALQWGTLPRLFSLTTDEERKIFLETYALTYLREEVWDEHLIRKLDPFRKFLQIAAQTNGEIVNYTRIAQDVRVDTKTVQQYFQILEDTLLSVMLEPYHLSVRKRQRVNPKFYLFDTGVKRALDNSIGVELRPHTYAFGKAFEHFLILEFHRLNSYLRTNFQFAYLQSANNLEIDLIITRPGKSTALIEIKSTDEVTPKDCAALAKLLPDISNSVGYLLSQDSRPQMFGEIRALHWREGLSEIFR